MLYILEKSYPKYFGKFEARVGLKCLKNVMIECYSINVVIEHYNMKEGFE